MIVVPKGVQVLMDLTRTWNGKDIMANADVINDGLSAPSDIGGVPAMGLRHGRGGEGNQTSAKGFTPDPGSLRRLGSPLPKKGAPR